MKAAIIKALDHLSVLDMPDPVPGDYDALCDLLYGATCTGTDSHILSGNFPWISPLPTVLGHESVGRVIDVGAKVRHLRVGDLVTRVGTPPAGEISVTWGGFAQLGIARDHWAMRADGLPESEWRAWQVNQIVPAGIDPKVAPMFTTWRETLSYIQRLDIVIPGARVLIVGSGGNGLSFAAHAANLGAKVTVIGAPRLREAVLAKTGTAVYHSYKEEQLDQLLSSQEPGGFDLIIDAIGKRDSAQAVLPCLKDGGHLAVYGIDDYGLVALNPTVARGAFTWHGGGNYNEAETHQQVCDLVRDGRLDATLWYDPASPWPLAEIAEAFRAIQRRDSVKALIDLS